MNWQFPSIKMSYFFFITIAMFGVILDAWIIESLISVQSGNDCCITEEYIYRSWALCYFLNRVLRRHCFSEYSYVKCLRCCGSYYMFGETATPRSSFLYKYQCLIFRHKSIERFILSWKYYTSLVMMYIAHRFPDYTKGHFMIGNFFYCCWPYDC